MPEGLYKNFTFLLSLLSAYFFRSSQSFGYFRHRNTKMRTTLLSILLVFVMGGYHASASHATIGSPVFQHSGKQQLFSTDNSRNPDLATSIYTYISEELVAPEDIEDDEDRHELTFKKTKTAEPALASAHILSLSRFHSRGLTAATTSGIASCKYITQRVLRI